MMILEEYKNNLPYPNRKDFTEVVEVKSKFGKVKLVVFVDEEGFKKTFDEYSLETSRLLRKFRKDLKIHFGIVNHPKADMIIEKAFNYGSNLEKIFDWCDEMVDLMF